MASIGFDEDPEIKVGAGALYSMVAVLAAKAGIAGLEFMSASPAALAAAADDERRMLWPRDQGHFGRSGSALTRQGERNGCRTPISDSPTGQRTAGRSDLLHATPIRLAGMILLDPGPDGLRSPPSAKAANRSATKPAALPSKTRSTRQRRKTLGAWKCRRSRYAAALNAAARKSARSTPTFSPATASVAADIEGFRRRRKRAAVKEKHSGVQPEWEIKLIGRA